MQMTGRGGLLMAAMIPCALLLTACDPKRIEAVRPPVALTECADEPTAPALPPVDWSSVETARPIQRQRDEATVDYLLQLRSAYGSCKADVVAIREWSAGLE